LSAPTIRIEGGGNAQELSAAAVAHSSS